MIPRLNLSGVLPPFLPSTGPTFSAAMAPYKTSLTEIITFFLCSPERIKIFLGLLEYRQLLRNAGITDGFQWIDESYVEDCERHRGRPPNDIDVVTFAERPIGCDDKATWDAFALANPSLFDRVFLKSQYQCDAFYEDLGIPHKVLVSRARFWFGLFSHQRTTYMWKGILEVPLRADDDEAREILAEE